MAKRFTDTDKYKKPFFRSLKAPYKLLWDYLYHDCDNCGIWIVDFDVAQIYLGADMKVNKAEALRCFNSDETRIIEIDGGKKWFIPSFITFQYGQLTETNRAHTKVISTLRRLELIDETLKVLPSPLQAPKEEEEGKEEEQDKGKEQDTRRLPETIQSRTPDFDSLPRTNNSHEERMLLHSVLGAIFYQLEGLSVDFGDPKIRALFPWWHHLFLEGRIPSEMSTKELIKRTDSATPLWISQAVSFSISNNYVGLVAFKKEGNGLPSDHPDAKLRPNQMLTNGQDALLDAILDNKIQTQ